MTTLEEKLAGWTGISSPTEQDKQDRTERMVREAIEGHPAFEDYKIEVYVKGSYANKTNVRADSDVDVAVKCNEVRYIEPPSARTQHNLGSYDGIWTPGYLRSELKKALVKKFDDQVDDSGSTAFKINSSTARVDADVVPCFDYRYYYASGGYRSGARVFKKDLSHMENYSQQQLDNGQAKDRRTNGNYKKGSPYHEARREPHGSKRRTSCRSVLLRRVPGLQLSGRDLSSFNVDGYREECDRPRLE
jgi:hypothetical protein